jgi:uncharacterized protein (UPF0332 family)
VTQDDLMRKAHMAARAARLLHDAEDFDGCANRAYYAMFDVARAYLVTRHGITTEAIKTHSGLLSAFSRLGVKQDGLDADLGRWLNQAGEVRASADYDSRSVDTATAAILLANMDRFVATLENELGAKGEQE